MGRGGCVNQEGRCETWSNAEKVFSVGLRDESHILPIAWNAFLPGSTIGRGGNHFIFFKSNMTFITIVIAAVVAPMVGNSPNKLEGY